MPTKKTTTKPAADVELIDETATIGALAQATAGSLGVLDLTHIHPHPHNVRRRATADEEMIASLRTQGLIQPLVVVPMPDTTGDPEYMLVAGHRRMDGLLRLEATHAMCVIRRDLVAEADQVASMLVENGRREDLTPLEEAEGYNLLTNLGWTDAKIGRAVGHAPSTVKSRKTLTGLAKKARTQLDNRQITLEQGVALAALPEAEQDKVLKSQSGFAYALVEANRRNDAAVAADAEAAVLDGRGVPRIPMPAGLGLWALNHADHGMARLDTTGTPDAAQHPHCLAYVIHPGTGYSGPVLQLVCTDPTVHDDDLSEQQREKRAAEAAAEAEHARQQAEKAEKAQADEIARGLRVDAVLGALKHKALDPILEALLRLDLMSHLDYDVDAVTGMTTQQVVRTWAEIQIGGIEDDLRFARPAWASPSPYAAPWFALLDVAGHERNPADIALLAEATAEQGPR